MTELYGLGITEDDILSKVEEQAAALAEWAQKFVRDEPHPIHGIINFKDGATQKSNASDNVSVCVSKVVDIEECVWSPKFGLKGWSILLAGLYCILHKVLLKRLAVVF